MPPKKINKPKTIRKTVLMNPTPIKWPEIKPIEETEIIDEIVKVTTEAALNEKPITRIEGIVLGFNVVSKQLERSKLCAVVICYMGKTLQLNEKLLLLCDVMSVPVVAIKDKVDDILKSFRIKSILALGIQKEYANLHKNLVQLIAKYYKPQTKPEDMERIVIPYPPDIEFPQNSNIKTSEIRRNDDQMDFIRLDSSLAFPKSEYPPELDFLQIKILDPSICDQPIKMEQNKRKFENSKSSFSNKHWKLTELNLKHTFHTPSEKKRDKKLKKNKQNVKK